MSTLFVYYSMYCIDILYAVCYYVITMKQIQTLQLEVLRDGQPDAEYVRKQRIAKAGNMLVIATENVTEALRRGLGELTTNIELNVYDSLHGTHLQQERNEQRRAAELAALREQHGIE